MKTKYARVYKRRKLDEINSQRDGTSRLRHVLGRSTATRPDEFLRSLNVQTHSQYNYSDRHVTVFFSKGAVCLFLAKFAHTHIFSIAGLVISDACHIAGRAPYLLKDRKRTRLRRRRNGILPSDKLETFFERK